MMKKPKIEIPTEPLPGVNDEPVEDLDIRLKDDPDAPLPFPDLDATRVSQLTIGRTINTGNFTSWRYEIKVDIGRGDSAAAVLMQGQTILNVIHQPQMEGRVEQFHRWSAQHPDTLSESQKAFLVDDRVKEAVLAYNQQVHNWKLAMQLLDRWGGTVGVKHQGEADFREVKPSEGGDYNG